MLNRREVDSKAATDGGGKAVGGATLSQSSSVEGDAVGEKRTRGAGVATRSTKKRSAVGAGEEGGDQAGECAQS